MLFLGTYYFKNFFGRIYLVRYWIDIGSGDITVDIHWAVVWKLIKDASDCLTIVYRDNNKQTNNVTTCVWGSW